MRLILTLRGVNVVDLELLWPAHREAAEEPPTLHASGGGQAERADAFGDPATIGRFGFGPS